MSEVVPFPYQEVGIDFLAGRRRALLLDDAGVGKTLQLVRAADRVADRLDTVCPASVVTQWGKENGRISETDRAFQARSYDNARERGLPVRMGALALDELHYLKNLNAKRTTRLLGDEIYGVDGAIIAADYVWGASATASPKDASDLYPAMRAIVPGSLKMQNGETMGLWQFLKKFCNMYDTGYGMTVTSSKNLDELKDRLAPYMLRRTKKEVFKDYKEPIYCELWLDSQEAADALRKCELEPEARLIAEVMAKEGFDGLKRLAEVDEKGVSRYRRYTGILMVVPVVAWLCDQFDAGMEKIVAVCVHREVISGIVEKLKEQGIESCVYWGGMTDREKEHAKTSFINNPKKRVFVVQLTAFGTGTDGVQHATGDMILVEFSWIADDNYQVVSRLDRHGQKNPVVPRFAGLAGSLHGAIMASAKRRAAEQRHLFG